MKAHQDPENYRKMSEPFSTSTEANEAIEKFFNAVELARNLCHIADVHVIARINFGNYILGAQRDKYFYWEGL